MRSNANKTYYYSASASALGGSILAPTKKIVSSQASVALPSVCGHAQHRTEAFHLDDVVSCTSSYAHVSGVTHGDDGPWTTLITAVVDGLNILEVVTADRVVAQLSIEHRLGASFPTVSFAGSHFTNLRIAGFDPHLAYNPDLLALRKQGSPTRTSLDWTNFYETGHQQAVKLVSGITADRPDSPFLWLADRLHWMAAGGIKEGDTVLCSLVDGIGTEAKIPGNSFGHVVDIPDFGRLYLGEILAQGKRVELTMIRAELGCATTGNVSAAHGVGGGTHVPPP